MKKSIAYSFDSEARFSDLLRDYVTAVFSVGAYVVETEFRYKRPRWLWRFADKWLHVPHQRCGRLIIKSAHVDSFTPVFRGDAQ